MYHMRKLISRGLVEKTDGNFNLTPDGARWLNKTGLDQQPEGPRCLIQLLVIVGDSILLAERRQHLAESMNRYLLPGGRHIFGETSLNSTRLLAQKLNLKLNDKLITQVETIIIGLSSHTIADIYKASTDNDNYSLEYSNYHLGFKPIKAVLAMSVKEAGSLPLILSQYLDKSLGQRSHFNLN